MASVDVTITYDDELGTPADVGEVLRSFATYDILKPEKLTPETRRSAERALLNLNAEGE